MGTERLKSDKLRFKHIARFVQGTDVLDIGSDEGYIHGFLVKRFPDKKFYTLDSSGKADFKINLDKPKKLGKQFDTIIAGEVIEHLASPISFITWCAQHLKKGGRLILTTPNATGLQYLRDPAWCVFYTNYRGHTQAFTLPMLRRIAQDEKLRVIHTDYLNAFWIHNPLEYVSLVFKRLRPDLLLVAEK